MYNYIITITLNTPLLLLSQGSFNNQVDQILPDFDPDLDKHGHCQATTKIGSDKTLINVAIDYERFLFSVPRIYTPYARHYNLRLFIPFLKTISLFYKEDFSENSGLMCDQYSRAVCIQERVMMAHLRYVILLIPVLIHSITETKKKNGVHLMPSDGQMDKQKIDLRYFQYFFLAWPNF